MDTLRGRVPAEVNKISYWMGGTGEPEADLAQWCKATRTECDIEGVYREIMGSYTCRRVYDDARE